LGWTNLWYVPLPDQPYATPGWLWKDGKKGSAIGRNWSNVDAAFEIRNAGQMFMNQFIYVWKQLRYKIELEQFELWNVCPVPKED